MKNVKRILLSMILVVVIQLCFPCDTISATELSASGRITGLQNGDAANVILYNNYQSYSAATDEKGDYSFRGIELGDYFVKIDMAGYSITLLKLDAELKELVNAPADTPAFVQV